MFPYKAKYFVAALAVLMAAGIASADEKKKDSKPVAPSRPAASAPSHTPSAAPAHTPSAPQVHTPTPGGGGNPGGTSTINRPTNNPPVQGGAHTPGGFGGNTGGVRQGSGNPAGGAGGGFGGNTGGVRQGSGNPTGGVGGGGSGRPAFGGGGGGGNTNAGGGRPNFGGGNAGGSRPVGNAGYTRPSNAGRYAPTNPGAGRVAQTRSGNQVMVRQNGRPSTIYANNGMAIRRGPAGTAVRRTVVERNGRVYSFNRAGYGHVRTSYSYSGREYVVRRYYVGGAYFPRYYRPAVYRGVFFDVYAPQVYYSPYYYGWVYRPWAAPVVFTWGWGRSPWYGYYGGYFTPYPTYPSANLWLTDYMVSQTLEASYREQVDSARAANAQFNNQPPPQMATLTPEIKQMIAEEVQRQLALESAEAQARAANQAPPQQDDPAASGIGRMIEDNKTHVVLSNANIDVTTTDGQECAISQGDAIGIFPGQGGVEGETVQVRVLATAGGGCPVNATVSISLQDLQEMLNHFRATIDQGLGEMQKSKDMPKPPPSVPLSTLASDFVSAAPPADPNEAAELTRLNTEATQTEQMAVTEASAAEPGSLAPPMEPGQPVSPAEPGGGGNTELKLGMTPDQVVAMLGAPTTNTKMGPKQIMTFKSLGVKLTFTDGRLTAME